VVPLEVRVPVMVGLALITNVEPVPVCEAIEVAFPTDVIGPVRLALVTTVVANDPVPLPVTPPVRVIVWSPVLLPEVVPFRILPARVMPPAPGVIVAIPAVFGALKIQLFLSEEVSA